jgi:hypothetical protein
MITIYCEIWNSDNECESRTFIRANSYPAACKKSKFWFNECDLIPTSKRKIDNDFYEWIYDFQFDNK